MKKCTKIGLGILVGILAILLAGCLYLNSLMPIVTGYAAKNLASAVFVSGRDAQDVQDLDLHFSLIQFTRNRVDKDAKTVTSRFLWSKSVAVYREGYGVTLVRGQKPAQLQAQAFPLPPMDPIPERLEQGDSALCAALSPIGEALVDGHAYNGTPFRKNSGGTVPRRHGAGHPAPELEHGQEFHQCPRRPDGERRDGGYPRAPGHSRVAA